jgi:phosphatidylglycerol lysyltransferase
MASPRSPHEDQSGDARDTGDAGDGGDARGPVLALLERHGWNATSFQIMERGFRYWFDGQDACVGYVDTGHAWVAAGPPIAPAERLAETSARFAEAARAAGRRVCLFGTEERFREASGWRALRIGEQPLWSPADWDLVLRGRRSLREQLRRARAKGVTVRMLAPDELAPAHATRQELEGLIARWLASRTIAPMGFLVQVDPFTFPERRRLFVAEVAGRVVGFLGVIPIYARGGWFFEDFLRDPDAPNGTIELLVDAGMRAAAAEGVAVVTLGLAPLAGDVGPWLRSARRLGRALYDFEGLRAFKAKLEPQRWSPIFLSYPPGGSAVRAVIDTLTAFARGGLLRFGLQTMLRGPAIVIRLLAALLVVWTALLALPWSAPYFPSPVWQYGWVAFDVALGGALFALARRWRQPLADIVAAAVTADAAITLGEALVYNAPRARGLADACVIAAAVIAPAFAAVLLWNARVHRAPRE